MMRKSLELCYSLLIPMVEGGSVSPISSVTKISEVDMTLPQKMKYVIKDNDMGRYRSYKHSKPLITATYWDVLVICTVYHGCLGGEAAPKVAIFISATNGGCSLT